MSFAVGPWVARHCQTLHHSKAALSQHTRGNILQHHGVENILKCLGVQQVRNSFYFRNPWEVKGISHQKKRLSYAVHVHILVYRNMCSQVFLFKNSQGF